MKIPFAYYYVPKVLTKLRNIEAHQSDNHFASRKHFGYMPIVEKVFLNRKNYCVL